MHDQLMVRRYVPDQQWLTCFDFQQVMAVINLIHPYKSSTTTLTFVSFFLLAFRKLSDVYVLMLA